MSRQSTTYPYRSITAVNPTGRGGNRWTLRRKPAPQALDIAFDCRLSVGNRLDLC
ncbi:hypothetical protein [Streptomyces sp. NPDC002156]